MQDRYGHTLNTTSHAAADAYGSGLDLFLSANHGAVDAFGAATAHDPDFALAHAALARAHLALGEVAAARDALKAAQARHLTARDAAHITITGHLIAGDGQKALSAIRAHQKDYPRDAMALQPALGVFGLIGFSGRSGREQANLEFAEQLAPHFGEDWWFLGTYAFALMETGDLHRAETRIDAALSGNPRNANGAHYKAHLHYENGETEAGSAYIEDWRKDYDPRGLMNGHIAWHSALWALARGDVDRMWEVVDREVAPKGAWGPALNVLTDTAAILYRAEMAGIEVSPERWAAISRFASDGFGAPGLAFADVHAALAHAMAGDGAALHRIIDGASGPAGDVVRDLAEGFGAIATGAWERAETLIGSAMRDHARIGGSRAQRDLVEYAYATTLLRQGRAEAAEAHLRARRGETMLGIDLRLH